MPASWQCPRDCACSYELRGVPEESHGPHQEIQAEPRNSPGGGHRPSRGPAACPERSIERGSQACFRPLPGQALRASCRGNRRIGKRPYRSLRGRRRAAPVDGADRQRRQRGRGRLPGAIVGHQAGRRQLGRGAHASRSLAPPHRSRRGRAGGNRGADRHLGARHRAQRPSPGRLGRAHHRTRAPRAGHRRDHRRREPHLGPDQPSRAQRRHRGGTGGRSRPRLRRRCRRGPRARRDLGEKRAGRPEACDLDPDRRSRHRHRASEGRRGGGQRVEGAAPPSWRCWMACAKTCKGSPRAARKP